jgi:phage terminase large subunit-like protein
MALKSGPKGDITAEPLTFDEMPAPGWERIDAFAREYLRVPKGTGAKEPFILRPWQLDILKQLYPMPHEGKRPRQGLVSMPRGNGKTGLAAVLAAYALFAEEQEGAQILVVASDERQAGMIYRAVRRMIELEPRLEEQTHVYRDRLYVPHTDSELRVLPADVGALQGWDPTLMIVDELHVVTEDVWEAVTTAAGKRTESLTLAISTPSDSSESVMWRLVEHGRRQIDPSFVYIEYAAPADCKLDDREAWRIANPALGDFLHEDAIEAILPPKTREAAFRRYRLGQWVGQADAWLPWGTWDALADSAASIMPKERVVLAFDGSASGDSTALVACTVDNPHLFVIEIWENPGDERWRVPREDVTAAVRRAFKDYNVVELAADPWGWRSEIESWAKEHGEKRVLEWNTGAASRMAPATDRLYQAIVTGAVSHDGDPRLSAHMHNAVAKSTPMGDLVSKDKRGSKRKIDAAVASIVAFERAAFHANSKTRRRVVVH